MNLSPEESPRSETPPKLDFKEPVGWYRYGRIPYKIRYHLDINDSGLVDGRNPGSYAVTQDLPGPEYSLSIWVHESVPKEFKNIIMYHELKEAELRLADELEKSEAHKQAVSAHMLYAQAHLSQKKLEEFKKWQQGLDNY